MSDNKRSKRGLLTAILLLVLASFMVSACREPGPAEEAGRTVDEAIEDARDAMDELGDDAREAIEDARDSMEDLDDEAEDALEELDDNID